MKTEIVRALTDTFEAHAQQTETACEVSGHAPADHFVDVNKTIAMPKGAEKEVPEIMLTRYACYPISTPGSIR